MTNRRRATLALLALLAAPAAAQRPALPARLDSVARAVVAGTPLAGATVVVLRGADTLLHAAYGEAELSLHAPATVHTRYRWLGGPGMLLLATAVLQQVRRGALALDEPASTYLPEFPWQGRRVTVRQLLNMTSGLPDYHYLGDAFNGAMAVPKTADEVTALFAGRPFVHEPGARHTWTIAGMHLAGVIVERVTREPFDRYVTREIVAPAGLRETVPCGDLDVVPEMAHGYAHGERADSAPPFIHGVSPSATTVRFEGGFCGTALDAARLARAVPRLLGAEGMRQLQGQDAPPVYTAPPDTSVRRGVTMESGSAFGRAYWGSVGNALLGFGTSFREFPADSLTLVVLSNTEHPNTSLLLRQLSRVVYGQPLLASSPYPPPARLADVPVDAAERARIVGEYDVRASGDSLLKNRAWRERVRVYEEAGRLLVLEAGFPPRRLLRQVDGAYAIEGDVGARLRFAPAAGRAATLTFQIGAGGPLAAGPRMR